MNSKLFRLPTFNECLDEWTEADASELSMSPLVGQTYEGFPFLAYDGSQAQDLISHQSPDTSTLESALDTLRSVEGFIAVALVSVYSGESLAVVSGDESFDIEMAAAVNAQVIKASLDAVEAIGSRDTPRLEDILITLEDQYHLLRPCSKDLSLFLHFCLDKERSNLAMARLGLSIVEQSLPSLANVSA